MPSLNQLHGSFGLCAVRIWAPGLLIAFPQELSCIRSDLLHEVNLPSLRSPTSPLLRRPAFAIAFPFFPDLLSYKARLQTELVVARSADLLAVLGLVGIARVPVIFDPVLELALIMSSPLEPAFEDALPVAVLERSLR